MTKSRPSYKAGYRGDLGISVRSSWEANYARYLDWLVGLGEVLEWEYEPTKFTFDAWGHRGANWCYIPDFRVVNKDGSVEYHEVKGRMDRNSKVKINRFRKYYPEHKLVIIDAQAYRALERDVCRLVPGWEGGPYG